MKKHLRFVLLGLLLAATLFLASCGGSGVAQQGNSGPSDKAQSTTEDTGSMSGMDTGSGETAPAMLVQDGNYSDGRFIDMMVPHHMSAIDMAKAAQQNAEHPEIKQLADNIISDQQKEIDELKDIRKREFGSPDTPTQMNPEEMDNMGMMMPDQLANRQPFDEAFIDSMMPHHSDAIAMASVVLMRSDDPDIRRIARGIIDGQAKEIGQMIQWRQEWYPEG